MAGKDWRGPSPRSGMACRSNAAPCTSTGTCSPMRPSVCTRRSPPTTRTWFTPRHRHRSRAAARPSSASGGSSVGRWPIASKKPAIASSPSRGCRRANGAAPGPPMRSSVCTKSSSDGSRRRRCCHQLRQPRCCFGRCSLPARSTCERLTVGGRLPKHPSVSQLTSRPDSVLSKCRRSRHPIPTQIATAPLDPKIRVINQTIPEFKGRHRLSRLAPYAVPIGESLHWSALYRWATSLAKDSPIAHYAPCNLAAAVNAMLDPIEPKRLPIIDQSGDPLDWYRKEEDRARLESLLPPEFQHKMKTALEVWEAGGVDMSAFLDTSRPTTSPIVRRTAVF